MFVCIDVRWWLWKCLCAVMSDGGAGVSDVVPRFHVSVDAELPFQNNQCAGVDRPNIGTAS